MSNPSSNDPWNMPPQSTGGAGQGGQQDPYGQPPASDPYGQSSQAPQQPSSDPYAQPAQPGQQSWSSAGSSSSASDPYGQSAAGGAHGQQSPAGGYQSGGGYASQPGGAPQPGAAAQPGGTPAGQSRMVVGLLGIFLGGWGVHRFLMGYTTIGIIQIVVTLVTCGFGAIWGFVEGIMVLAKTESFTHDAHGRPLTD